jgi:hypothetical protein
MKIFLVILRKLYYICISPNQSKMKNIDLKQLIDDLQKLLDKGETTLKFEGTILCIEQDGCCNCVRSTEPQM